LDGSHWAVLRIVDSAGCPRTEQKVVASYDSLLLLGILLCDLHLLVVFLLDRAQFLPCIGIDSGALLPVAFDNGPCRLVLSIVDVIKGRALRL